MKNMKEVNIVTTTDIIAKWRAGEVASGTEFVSKEENDKVVSAYNELRRLVVEAYTEAAGEDSDGPLKTNELWNFSLTKKKLDTIVSEASK